MAIAKRVTLKTHPYGTPFFGGIKRIKHYKGGHRSYGPEEIS
jgi:hypothetical protein